MSYIIKIATTYLKCPKCHQDCEITAFTVIHFEEKNLHNKKQGMYFLRFEELIFLTKRYFRMSYYNLKVTMKLSLMGEKRLETF